MGACIANARRVGVRRELLLRTYFFMGLFCRPLTRVWPLTFFYGRHNNDVGRREGSPASRGTTGMRGVAAARRKSRDIRWMAEEEEEARQGKEDVCLLGCLPSFTVYKRMTAAYLRTRGRCRRNTGWLGGRNRK